MVSNTGWISCGEIEITRRTSAVAACSSCASLSSRACRSSRSCNSATEGSARPTAFDALRRSGVVVLRRCNLADLPPALERRLIAFPKAQDKASCRFKVAHWKRPGAVLCVTANFNRECPLRSEADIDECLGHVRFTPESGHWNSVVECLLCAKSGHSVMRRKTSPI